MRFPLAWLADYVELPKDRWGLAERLTMAGHLLDKSEGKKDFEVFDLELRLNRADLYSILGMGREVAALYDKKLIYPEGGKFSSKKLRSLFQVTAQKAVNRFLAVKIEKIDHRQTPDQWKKRLKLYGIPAINKIVDLTNFVMVELGQPLHAFDASLVEGKLNIRFAKTGESFISLDGTSYLLEKKDLVIADEKKVLALAGIIGARAASISQKTREIIVEAANYQQVFLRETAQRHKIRTEASTRLEKKIDPSLVETAILRFLYLLEKKDSGYQDYYPRPEKGFELEFDLGEVKRLLGFEIEREKIREILQRLEFRVKNLKGRNDSWRVKVPGFRPDVEGPADLVEEIIRVYGFEKIPSLPLIGRAAEPVESKESEFSEKVRLVLTGLGFHEVIANPIGDKKHFQKWGRPQNLISLVNPVTEELNSLRTSLWPGLVNYLKTVMPEKKGLALFETGRVFGKDKTGSYQEETKVAGVMAGEKVTAGWGWPAQDWDFFEAKGMIEAFLQEFEIDAVFLPAENRLKVGGLDERRAAIITSGLTKLGVFGQISPRLATYNGLGEMAIFLFELDLAALIKAKKRKVYFFDSQKYPPVVEDISVIIKDKVGVQKIIELIQSVSAQITKVELWDVHDNSRTFRIWYQDPEKTLKADEVYELRKKLVSELKKIDLEIR